jgi:hypothetical protein
MPPLPRASAVGAPVFSANPTYSAAPGYPPSPGYVPGYPAVPPSTPGQMPAAYAAGAVPGWGYPMMPGHASGPAPVPGYPTALPGYPPTSPGYPPALPGYPPAGMGRPLVGAGVPAPPPDGRWQPSRVDPVAGTEFGLMQLQVPPVRSGLATGSMIAGIGSILVSFLVLCFGVAGASGGWGAWVAGAFTVLGVLVGGGAIALGLVAKRQISRSGQSGLIRFTGHGTAVAGIACGAAGAGISVLSLALGLVLQLS